MNSGRPLAPSRLPYTCFRSTGQSANGANSRGRIPIFRPESLGGSCSFLGSLCKHSELAFNGKATAKLRRWQLSYCLRKSFVPARLVGTLS